MDWSHELGFLRCFIQRGMSCLVLGRPMFMERKRAGLDELLLLLVWNASPGMLFLARIISWIWLDAAGPDQVHSLLSGDGRN